MNGARERNKTRKEKGQDGEIPRPTPSYIFYQSMKNKGRLCDNKDTTLLKCIYNEKHCSRHFMASLTCHRPDLQRNRRPGPSRPLATLDLSLAPDPRRQLLARASQMHNATRRRGNKFSSLSTT